MDGQTMAIHYFRADTTRETESLCGRANVPAIHALFQEKIAKKNNHEAGWGYISLAREGGRPREETKTIDIVGTGKQGNRARTLFTELANQNAYYVAGRPAN